MGMGGGYGVVQAGAELEYTRAWFSLTDEINGIDRTIYAKGMDEGTKRALEEERSRKRSERRSYRKGLEDERRRELIDDISELTGATTGLKLRYIPTEYVTLISPRDARQLTYSQHAARRVSSEEKRALEEAGYDVTFGQRSYSTRGTIYPSIFVSDSFDELMSTFIEGHEAAHGLMRGSRLDDNYADSGSRTICETAANIFAEARARHYVEKHYSGSPEALERMELAVGFLRNYASLIMRAREEVLPLIGSGDVEGADAVLERYTSMTDEVLGSRYEVNRAAIAFFGMYSANEEVNDALRTLERERGLGGMLESVRDAASVEGLLDIARAGPGGW